MGSYKPALQNVVMGSVAGSTELHGELVELSAQRSNLLVCAVALLLARV